MPGARCSVGLFLPDKGRQTCQEKGPEVTKRNLKTFPVAGGREVIRQGKVERDLGLKGLAGDVLELVFHSKGAKRSLQSILV